MQPTYGVVVRQTTDCTTQQPSLPPKTPRPTDRQTGSGCLKKQTILYLRLFKQRPKKRLIRLAELIIAMAIAITITIAATPRVQLVVELRVDLPHAPRVVALCCRCFCRCFFAFHLPHAPRVMARCCTCFVFALLLLLLLLTKMILLRLRLPPAPAKYVWESA